MIMGISSRGRGQGKIVRKEEDKELSHFRRDYVDNFRRLSQ